MIDRAEITLEAFELMLKRADWRKKVHVQSSTTAAYGCHSNKHTDGVLTVEAIYGGIVIECKYDFEYYTDYRDETFYCSDPDYSVYFLKLTEEDATPEICLFDLFIMGKLPKNLGLPRCKADVQLLIETMVA